MISTKGLATDVQAKRALVPLLIVNRRLSMKSVALGWCAGRESVNVACFARPWPQTMISVNGEMKPFESCP